MAAIMYLLLTMIVGIFPGYLQKECNCFQNKTEKITWNLSKPDERVVLKKGEEKYFTCTHEKCENDTTSPIQLTLKRLSNESKELHFRCLDLTSEIFGLWTLKRLDHSSSGKKKIIFQCCIHAHETVGATSKKKPSIRCWLIFCLVGLILWYLNIFRHKN